MARTRSYGDRFTTVAMLAELRTLDTAPRALRRFGLLVGAVLLVLGAFAAWRETGAATGLLAAGGALVGLGALVPKILKWPYVVWMALALALGFVMTRVLLTIVYFVVVTPIGLILRISGRDPMHRRPDPSKNTYWIAKEPDGDVRERLERYY